MLAELQSRSKAQVILESGFLTLILSFSLVANSITLLVMLLNRRRETIQTIPNMLVASLAVTDLCLGVLVSALSGPVALVTSRWPFNDWICQFYGYISITLAAASIHTLVLMAVNRFFRIVKPSKYRRFFTKKKTIIMILMSWLHSMCAPLPYFLSGKKMVFHPSKFFCYLRIDSGAFGAAFLVAVYVGIPSCIIFYCYLRIFKTIRSHNNNLHFPGNGINSVNVEEIKVARTLFVIVVCFNLCWAPVLLIDIVDTILGRCTFPREAYVAYTFLANISSALNPLIYGVLNKNFRNDYIKVLSCRYCCSQAAVEPNAGLPGSANVLEIKPLRVPNVERKPGLLTKNKRRWIKVQARLITLPPTFVFQV